MGSSQSVVDVYEQYGGYAGSFGDGILKAASDITGGPYGQVLDIANFSVHVFTEDAQQQLTSSISTPKKISIIVLPVIQQVSTSLSLDRNGEENACVWQYTKIVESLNEKSNSMKEKCEDLKGLQ